MKKIFVFVLIIALGAAISPVISAAQKKDSTAASSETGFECPHGMTKAECKELLDLREKISSSTTKMGAKNNIVDYFAERRKETHLSPGKDLMEELTVLRRIQSEYEKMKTGRIIPPLAQMNSSTMSEKVRRSQLINKKQPGKYRPKAKTAQERQQIELIKIRRGLNGQEAQPISFEDMPNRDLISLYEHFGDLQENDDRATPERIKGYKKTQNAIRDELCKRDDNASTGTRKEPGKKICK